MEKTVLIIEDNPIQLELLEKLTREVNVEAKVYKALNLAQAYKILMEKTIDVFLVDIILDTNQTGDISGIKLVKKMREIPKYMFTPVLFITSLEDSTGYAYKDLNCLGYVEKPFDPERVKRLIEKAMHFTTARSDDVTICFRKEGIIFPIKEADIYYIESQNHSLKIHIKTGEILNMPYMTCKQILEEADSNNLMQCSRCLIINKRYIENIDFSNRYITLKGKQGRVEIGITYKKKLIAEYGL